MPDQAQNQTEQAEASQTRKPSVKARAAAWAKNVYNHKEITFAYREGYRICSALLDVHGELNWKTECDIWIDYKDTPLDSNFKALENAFLAGVLDAADIAGAEHRDLDPNGSGDISLVAAIISLDDPKLSEKA